MFLERECWERGEWIGGWEEQVHCPKTLISGLDLIPDFSLALAGSQALYFIVNAMVPTYRIRLVSDPKFFSISPPFYHTDYLSPP